MRTMRLTSWLAGVILLLSACAQLGLVEPKTIEDRLLYAAAQRNALIDVIVAKKADGTLSGDRLAKAKAIAWDMGRIIRAANDAIAFGHAIKPDGCQAEACDAPLTSEAALAMANNLLLALKEILK